MKLLLPLLLWGTLCSAQELNARLRYGTGASSLKFINGNAPASSFWPSTDYALSFAWRTNEDNTDTEFHLYFRSGMGLMSSRNGVKFNRASESWDGDYRCSRLYANVGPEVIWRFLYAHAAAGVSHDIVGNLWGTRIWNGREYDLSEYRMVSRPSVMFHTALGYTTRHERVGLMAGIHAQLFYAVHVGILSPAYNLWNISAHLGLNYYF